MCIEPAITNEQLERYRRIISESSPCSLESDRAIMLVGRIVQNVIDRARGVDSVQLSLYFNEKSNSKLDSSDANLSKMTMPFPSCSSSSQRLEL